MSRADKFEALVHYICWRCQDPTKLGATKLNKVLWFSDAIAFVNHGKPITDSVYVKRQFGPVPKKILQTLSRLERGNKLAVRETEYFGKPKREFFAKEPADITIFTAEEISLVDYVIDRICEGHTAASISDLTHDDVWELAEIGEEIPLYAVLAGRAGEVDEESIKWSKQEAERLGYAA